MTLSLFYRLSQLISIFLPLIQCLFIVCPYFSSGYGLVICGTRSLSMVLSPSTRFSCNHLLTYLLILGGSLWLCNAKEMKHFSQGTWQGIIPESFWNTLVHIPLNLKSTQMILNFDFSNRNQNSKLFSGSDHQLQSWPLFSSRLHSNPHAIVAVRKEPEFIVCPLLQLYHPLWHFISNSPK